MAIILPGDGAPGERGPGLNRRARGHRACDCFGCDVVIIDILVCFFHPGDVVLRECGLELGRSAGDRRLCVGVDDVLHLSGGDVVEDDVGSAAAIVVPGDVVPADGRQPLLARVVGELRRRLRRALVEVDVQVPVPVVLPGDVVSRDGRSLLRVRIGGYPLAGVTGTRPKGVYRSEIDVLLTVPVVFPDDHVAVDIRVILRVVEGVIERLPRCRIYRRNRRYQQSDDGDCTKQCHMHFFGHSFPPC